MPLHYFTVISQYLFLLFSSYLLFFGYLRSATLCLILTKSLYSWCKMESMVSYETGDCHIFVVISKIIPFHSIMLCVFFFSFTLCAIRYFCLLSRIWCEKNVLFHCRLASATAATFGLMSFRCHWTKTKAFEHERWLIPNTHSIYNEMRNAHWRLLHHLSVVFFICYSLVLCFH